MPYTSPLGGFIMLAYSIGSATISFGLVAIPIKLYTAAVSAGASFQVAKDQYVPVTEEELQALAGAASTVIAITEFVPLPRVDPIYFERTYYLGPDKGGAKAYRLLT